jgi:Fe-S cluster assembly ATP-binding protein
VSHHLEFLHQIKPNKIVVLVDGKIVKTGNISLVKEIEKNGYKQYTKNVAKNQDFEITDPYLACHKQ